MIFPWYKDRLAQFDERREYERIQSLPIYKEAKALQDLPNSTLVEFEHNCLEIERLHYERYQSVLKQSLLPTKLTLTFTIMLYGLLAALALHILVYVQGLSPEYVFMRPFLFFGGGLMVVFGCRALMKTNRLELRLTDEAYEIVESRFFQLGIEAGKLQAFIDQHKMDPNSEDTIAFSLLNEESEYIPKMRTDEPRLNDSVQWINLSFGLIVVLGTLFTIFLAYAYHNELQGAFYVSLPIYRAVGVVTAIAVAIWLYIRAT